MNAAGRQGFAHLHVHSHYTLLGGTAPLDELAARAAAEGMTHLALTDTNALYGAVAFCRACRAAGVQPILGMAATVSPPGERIGPLTSPGRTRPLTSPGQTGPLTSGRTGPLTAPGRLVLLATGAAGYRSLCRLSSHLQAHPEREIRAALGLRWEELAAHREGLICLSGGRMGWVERLLRAGNTEAATRYALASGS